MYDTSRKQETIQKIKIRENRKEIDKTEKCMKH